MNIFREIDAFYGDEQKGRGDPLHSIFRLAGQIRRELGPKGYLLDNYLDLVLQGLNMVVTGEAVEEGTEAAYQFQLKLLSHIVDGTEPEEPHPLFDHVRLVTSLDGRRFVIRWQQFPPGLSPISRRRHSMS